MIITGTLLHKKVELTNAGKVHSLKSRTWKWSKLIKTWIQGHDSRGANPQKKKKTIGKTHFSNFRKKKKMDVNRGQAILKNSNDGSDCKAVRLETCAAKTWHNSKPLLMEKHIILKLELQRTWMRIMCVGFGESRFEIGILLMFGRIRANEFPLIKFN